MSLHGLAEKLDWQALYGEDIGKASGSKLWSLLRLMRNFDFGKFYEIGIKLTAVSKGLHTVDPGKLFNKSNSSFFVRLLTEMQQLCEETGLRVSARHIERTVKDLSVEPPNFLGLTFKTFGNRVDELQKRIVDELESEVFFQLDQGSSHFYSKRDLFGSEVATAFPGVSDDAEEAGKCLALKRPTASVFHLMRVLEIGIRSLGKSLNDPRVDPSKNPNWGAILQRCDQELKKAKSKRTPGWQKDDIFYAEATANLRAVKDAWRNPTMHVERTYSSEQAVEVFNAVKSFMRHLSKKLTG